MQKAVVMRGRLYCAWALLCAALLSTSVYGKDLAPQAQGWRDETGAAVPNSEHMQVQSGFAGSLITTTDEDWAEKWNTPPETKPSFTLAKRVPYGKKLFVLTFFANPKRNAQGLVSVRCDVRMRDPAGKVVMEQKNITCFKGRLQGAPNNLHMAAATVTFIGEAGDPSGEWVAEVTLRDDYRKVSLPLRTRFALVRAVAPGQ